MPRCGHHRRALWFHIDANRTRIEADGARRGLASGYAFRKPGDNVLARLFVLIGGLIVLALTMALVGPYFIDWTSYRTDFEREASRILGRQVTVAGDAQARILPFPSVTFSDVKVAGETPEAPSMTVETFSMDAELAPFMRGEFLIFDMRLHKPVLTIDVADNGLIDWTIRPNTPFDASHVKLENISISDGRITIEHAAGNRSYLLDKIDAKISARTLAGPWRIAGEMEFDGSPMAVTVSTGTASSDGSLRLRLKAKPGKLPVALETDGNVRIADGGATYTGLFRMEAAESEEADEVKGDDSSFAISIEAEEEPVIPFRFSGRFKIDHRLIDIPEFLFETGTEADPYTAEGTAFLDYGEEPRFSVQADGQQIRIDRKASVGDGSRPLADRISVFRDMVQSLPKPRIPGIVRVDLPAIVAGDTTVREVRLAAKPEDTGWQIEKFSAQLPGRATIEADGSLLTGSDFGFHGSLLLAVNQPSGFAAWLSQDVDEAIRRLPAAGFSALVDINAERQTFRDLELILGGARFTGEIDHLLLENAKPSMLLRLDGGALDVDGLAAFASIFVRDTGAARFAEHDLDLVVKAGPVSAGGMTAGSVDTAMRLKNGLLDIDRLSVVDLAGATLSATGRLKSFPESPTGNLDASVVSVDLEPLVALLAKKYPKNRLAVHLAERAELFPGLFTDTRIDLVGSAAANSDDSIGLAVSAHGMSGTGRYTVSGSGNLLAGEFDGPLSVTLTVNNDDAAPLFALYGLPAAPLDLTGPAETSLTIAGEIGSLFETNLLLRGQGTEAAFKGWTGIVDDRWQATGKATVKSSDVEPWLATAGVVLPGFGNGLSTDIAFEIDHNGIDAKIANLAGNLGGRPVKGDVAARLSGTKPAVSGTLSVPDIDVVPLAAMLLGPAGTQYAREGDWSRAPFASKAGFPFSGELELSAGRLAFGLEEPLDNARMTLAVSDNGVRISNLEGRFGEAQISGLGEIKNNAGTALISIQFRYGNASLSKLARTEALQGRATISASLTANGKSMAGLISSLSGSGAAIVEDIVVPGANPDVFGRIVEKADTFGRDIKAGDVAVFADGLVGSGSYPAGKAELSFVVAGGVLRTPEVQFDQPGARLQSELKLDLYTGKTQILSELTYDPGREALVGAVPAVRLTSTGRLGSVTTEYDATPLAQFLTQRALEIEQSRVESLQAGLLEKQRLRREVRYYASLEQDRLDEEARRRAEQEALDVPEEEADASGPTAGTLEDAVRRILDEEAAKRTQEKNQPDKRSQQLKEGTVTELRPVISGVEDGDLPVSAEEGSTRAFEKLRDDKLTIENFLRTLDR